LLPEIDQACQRLAARIRDRVVFCPHRPRLAGRGKPD
jgi:hypothetical protein